MQNKKSNTLRIKEDFFLINTNNRIVPTEAAYDELSVFCKTRHQSWLGEEQDKGSEMVSRGNAISRR